MITIQWEHQWYSYYLFHLLISCIDFFDYLFKHLISLSTDNKTMALIVRGETHSVRASSHTAAAQNSGANPANKRR